MVTKKLKVRFSVRSYVKEFDKTEAPGVVESTPVTIAKSATGDIGEIPKKKYRRSPALVKRTPSPKRKR